MLKKNLFLKLTNNILLCFIVDLFVIEVISLGHMLIKLTRQQERHWEMLILADKEERGGLAKADIG